MHQNFEHISDPSLVSPRIAALRTELKHLGIDGFIIPHADRHGHEYLRPSSERLAWLTGFSGSAGMAIVLADRAVLFIDGRYTLQAARQTDTELFETAHLMDEPPGKWLSKNFPKGVKLGFDPWLHTVKGVKSLEKAAELVPCQTNPVDIIWTDRPPQPDAPITSHPLKYAGQSAEEKLEILTGKLKEAGADAGVMTRTDCIAWAFNIRSSAIAHCPVPIAFAIISAKGGHVLFADGQIPEHKTSPYDALQSDLKSLKGKVRLDPATCAYAIENILKKSGIEIIHGQDFCIPLKAVKNKAEINGARAAHKRDGAALTRFLAWLSRQPHGSVTEISAAKKLENFRAVTGKLKDISFDTISGSGPNGAIVHYRVSTATDRTLNSGELYLVDSGGQYQDGTTDVTRTIAIGTPPEEAKRHFTLVLKGHIAVASARFPQKANGAQLDGLARNALWKAGLDYDHGTGHGVGSYLSVHEGPQNISKSSNIEFKPGMIVSNEPGYYLEGHYGIRIENLLLVSESKPIEGGTPMLGFETLTLAPIDRNLIDASLLSADEQAWLGAYHARIYEEIGPLLPQEDREWLKKATG